MDYIVFGTGYGATLLLLGWALRTFGPRLRYQDAGTDTPASADVLVYRLSWTRFAEALGTVVAIAGSVVVLVTFVTALINPENDAGALVLWVCFALVLLGSAIWLWFYVARYGAEGLVPERMDIGRLLTRREQPIRPQAFSSAPESLRERAEPVAEEPVVPERDDHGMFEDAEDDEGEYVDDDVADEDAEMAIRYSRYQVHHPDETRDDAYRDLFSIYASEELHEAEAEADVPVDPPDVPDEFDEPEPEPDPEPIHIHDEDGDEDDEPVVEEESHDMPETLDDVSEPADDLPDDVPDDEPVFDSESPLPDTPEGRAEALRRLQAWHPDEDA